MSQLEGEMISVAFGFTSQTRTRARFCQRQVEQEKTFRVTHAQTP
jgi:hypothetical protein